VLLADGWRDAIGGGAAVVDRRRDRVVASLEFQSAVEEIFDVQLLLGLCFPEVFGFQMDIVQHTFVVPPAATGAP
jgi:hypothetical protein